MNIQETINLNLPESQKLEYKGLIFTDGKFSSLNDKQKLKLAREICAFANAQGGDIIIAVSEDNAHNPTRVNDVGIDESTFEMWEQAFRQYTTAKIKPTIHGLKSNLETVEGKNILHIEVPKSVLKPHALINENIEEFVIRYGNTINNMNLGDLRSAFQERNLLENKVLEFRDNRLSMIYQGEVTGELEDQSILVLHIIPEWSMKLNSYTNLENFEKNHLVDVFSPTNSGDKEYRRGSTTYNADGLFINYGYTSSPIMSYTQVFHNASIETIEVRMMNYQHDDNFNSKDKEYIYNWHSLERILVKRISDITEVLQQNEIPQPYNVFVTLLNVKNKQTLVDWGDVFPNPPIHKDIVRAVPAYVSEENTLEEALFPMLTSLAHVFGFKYSSLYSEGGESKSEEF